MRYIVRLLALMFLCGSASAASSDCTTFRTPVEKLICEDETLSRLDSQVGNPYRLAVGYVAPVEKPCLQSEQKTWLATVRDKCRDAGCLVSAYAARIRAETPREVAEFAETNCPPGG